MKFSKFIFLSLTTLFGMQNAYSLDSVASVDLAVAEYFRKNPIDESALRAEYRRQVDVLKSMGSVQQYQLRLLVVPTETQALEATRYINKGQSMEELVRQSSTDPSQVNGGLVDWLLPNQMLPSIANVVVNLSKGQVTAAPIQTPAGWNVLRVEDVRPFVVPKFEESIAQLRFALVAQRRAAYLALRTSNSSSSTTIESASAKCVELGFKKGTEKFGDCVLKISK
jgi:peptidyl-prolyl cis-trans isomerase C